MNKWPPIYKKMSVGAGLFFVFLPFAAIAKSYYDEHEVGWHWYESNQLENKKDKNKLSPVMQMKAVRQTLEVALDKAVLSPTPENVKNYIVLQNQIGERSSLFAKVWQQVLLENPMLDYSIKHPTNQIGREVYVDELNKEQDHAIKDLAKHSGLFFFYRSTCPYCQRFSPIVKDFSERYGIAVVPISTDGIALSEFPESRIDQGQAQRFGVKAEPALFTVDPYAHQAVPVSYGLISESDLRQRILEIAKQKQETQP